MLSFVTFSIHPSILVFFYLDKTIHLVGGEGAASQGSILNVESYNTDEPGWVVTHTLPKGESQSHSYNSPTLKIVSVCN